MPPKRLSSLPTRAAVPSSAAGPAAPAAATAAGPFLVDSQTRSGGSASGIGTSSCASAARRNQAASGTRKRDGSSSRSTPTTGARRPTTDTSSKLAQPPLSSSLSPSRLSSASSDNQDDGEYDASDAMSRLLTSVCWLFAAVCAIIAIVTFTQLRAAPSLHDTETHCARRAIQLQAQFDAQALSLVRHVVAFLSAIGNTTAEEIASYVHTLNPDPQLVAAVTIYQRVTQRTRAQWVRDYSEIMAPPRTDIWSLPDVTLRPPNMAELWPCIAQVPISNASKVAAVTFPFIGFDPLGEASRATPMLKALASPTAKPSMSALVKWPADRSLGFNIYARNYRPVVTRSNVSREVAVAVHFMGKGLFDAMWAPNAFDYRITTDTTDLFRTAPDPLLLTDISSTTSVSLVDRPILLNCYARPVHGLFAYQYGSHLALLTSLLIALGFAALAMEMPKRLARALRSSGDLKAARSLIRSLHGRAQAILMAIEVPVALVDAVGRMVPLNEPAWAWMGNDCGACGGVEVKDVVDLPPEDANGDGAGAEGQAVADAVEVEDEDASEHALGPAGSDWIVLDSGRPRGRAPHTHANPRCHSAVVLPPIARLEHQPRLPFRPGLVQVTVRRPADGFEYPAQISASGPFTVPDAIPTSSPTLAEQKTSRLTSARNRLRSLVTCADDSARQIDDTERALVPTATSNSSSTERSRTSARSRRHSSAPAPAPAHQQVVLITDRSDAATRASDLEHARTQLALAHKACTDMLLLLCHELRNPAHVISGLLDAADGPSASAGAGDIARVSARLVRYLDQGTLLLGQETDASVPGVPVRGWALVELVRTVCRHRCPAGLAGMPKVIADARVMRLAPTGGAMEWQRMIRVMLGVAVDVCAGTDTDDGAAAAGDHGLVFELRHAWGPERSGGWRVQVSVRIPLARDEQARNGAVGVVEDMQRVAEWARQVGQARLASSDDVFGAAHVPPAPPEPSTWAGLHVLVLWRLAVSVAGRDPRVSVYVEKEGKPGRQVMVVSVDVECHIV